MAEEFTSDEVQDVIKGGCILINKKQKLNNQESRSKEEKDLVVSAKEYERSSLLQLFPM